ncbi:hypothetical protein [Methanobacterium sp.]|uniref:hypothetical protein n=1 Tax=Methanobacterium sp. TaxID=2164 RepID=UPI002AB91DA2|nr:hypothetical protein [Methanobacterium sp.]MDY9922740.1 hypothetical protein [Methanobacterium sp.]
MPIAKSNQLSESHVSLKDVNLALKNNYAILATLEETDPKREEIRIENEKLFEKGFEIINMQV